MKSRFLMTAVAAVTMSALVAQPSFAAEEEQFETVKTWAITMKPNASGSKSCFMARQYKDKDDNNAVNAIVAAVADANLVVSLVYEHWAWDKNDKVTVPMSFDKKLINANSAWEGDAETLTGVFPDAVVPDLLKAKKIILRFDNGNADFDIAGFSDAYVSLNRCERTVAAIPAPAPVAAATEAEIKYYFMGMLVQKSTKDCDIGTTGKQRAAVDAKVAALQPRMGAVEASFREQLKTDPAFSCPPAAKKAKLEATVAKFVDLTPDQFFVALDDAVKAEDAAKAKAEADIKAKADTDLRAKIEAEIRTKVEGEMKAKVEAEMKAKTDAEMKAKIDTAAAATPEAKP